MKSKREKKDDPLAVYRNSRAKDSVLDQEQKAAKSIGGVRHGGSGANQWRKSDASSDRYQLEAKQTANYSFSVKLEWLEKICFEAYGRGRIPLLHLRFLAASQGTEQDWIMMPVSEFEGLKQGDNRTS